MTKPCFAFTLNNPYIFMFKALLRSILETNPKFDYRIYIFCDFSLSKGNRVALMEIYPNIIFHEVDREAYVKVGKLTIKYYSIEAFSLYKYGEEKVILTGADCLCISSLDELVALDVDLGMPREKRRQDMFSNGVMAIGKKYLNAETYEALIEADYSHVEMFGNDMKLYNCFFKGRITEIDFRYDVVNTEIDYIDFDKIVFLHLVNKPTEFEGWKKLGEKVFDLWLRYYRMDYPEAAKRCRKNIKGG